MSHPFPTLRSFVAGAIEELTAKRITMADLDVMLAEIEKGTGLTENELAFAGKLEELGAAAAPDPFDRSADYRLGYTDGYVAALTESGQAPKLHKVVKRRTRGRK